MVTIKGKKARELLMQYNQKAFTELEQHFGKIIEVTYHVAENYFNKYDYVSNNYFVVLKTDKNICIILFSGLYYESIEPEYDGFAVKCEYIIDLDSPFPEVSQDGKDEDLEYEYGCDIVSCLYKNEFYEGDIELLIDHLERNQ